MISRFCYDYTITDLFYSLLKVKGNHIDTESLSDFFSPHPIYFTNFARTGLRVLLTALNLEPGARIGVQAYTCHTVFQAIAKAGFTPCFIDIDDNYAIDTADLERKIDAIDALIVCHTFGIPACMEKIKKITSAKPVIEDCAHSLFSLYNDRLTGTIGDAAIFSFGHGKYPSIGKGGFTIVTDKSLSERVNAEIHHLKRTSTIAEIKNAVINYIWAFAYKKPIYSLLTFPVGKRLDKKMDFLGKFTFNESSGFNSNIALLSKKFAYYKKVHQKQLKNGRYLSQQLKGMFGCIAEYEAGDHAFHCTFNYYLFPLRSKKRDDVVAALLKKGIESGKHFHQSLTWAGEYGYQPGDCPNTEKIVSEIFTVPSNYKLKEKHLDKIINTLKEIAAPGGQ